MKVHSPLIPAKAGIQKSAANWIPAFAGMSGVWKRTICAANCIILTLAGQSHASDYGDGTYDGVYVDLFETSGFEPCDSDEKWWLIPVEPINSDFWKHLKELRAEYELSTGTELGSASPPYFLKASGFVTDQGEFGHMGKYDREFRISSFDEFRLATHDELRQCMTSGYLPQPNATDR